MKFLLALALVAFAAASLPTNFDARQQWSHCSWDILNQEQCGSCWDFCSVESFANRMCITGEAPVGTIISPETILDCSGQGCDGGWPSTAWNYLIKDGSATCTGQCFHGCQPYDSGSGHSPSCHQGTCDSGGNWPVTYKGGSYSSLSSLRNHDLDLYMTDLMNNGPLQMCFTVYNNFYTFFSLHPTGIYTESSGANVGGHCVKTVGWGVTGGQEYWLLANSWDTTWGDQGYFRMARGTNLCGIEGQVSEGFTKKQTAVLGKPEGVYNTSDFLVGGWQQQEDLSSEMVTDAKNAAVKLLTGTMDLSAAELVAAESQVVAGTNFKLSFSTGQKVRLHRDLNAVFSLVNYQM